MKALSFALEGLFGAGKTKAIRLLFPQINPSLERIWVGYGYHFSVRKATEQALSIEKWVKKRNQFFLRMESLCDYLILERCAFSDFSNLCFRKNLIPPQTLWCLNQWWPDWIILIKSSVETCLSQIRARGDDFRADTHDLLEFENSINKAINFLKGYLDKKIIIVSDADEAYQRGLEFIEARRKMCSI